jgi:hypothetical protein
LCESSRCNTFNRISRGFDEIKDGATILYLRHVEVPLTKQTHQGTDDLDRIEWGTRARLLVREGNRKRLFSYLAVLQKQDPKIPACSQVRPSHWHEALCCGKPGYLAYPVPRRRRWLLMRAGACAANRVACRCWSAAFPYDRRMLRKCAHAHSHSRIWSGFDAGKGGTCEAGRSSAAIVEAAGERRAGRGRARLPACSRVPCGASIPKFRVGLSAGGRGSYH